MYNERYISISMMKDVLDIYDVYAEVCMRVYDDVCICI